MCTALAARRVCAPVWSWTTNPSNRHTSQDACPWNRKFAGELKDPAYAPREALAGKDARTLARALLAMEQPGFSGALKGPPKERAGLRGLERNAAVVLGGVVPRSVGTADDAAALAATLASPLHIAAWTPAHPTTDGGHSATAPAPCRVRRRDRLQR